MGSLLLVGILGTWYWFSLPNPLFSDGYSTVINASNGKLLGAGIAPNGQWRFPGLKTVPPKFEKALLQFEDSYFYSHPGINPVSLWKALVSNVKSGKYVRGGSTISMQLIRISRKGRSRSLGQKIIEMALATRAELRYSKAEILELYAANAPFGSNVVGIEAAAWRYFGRTPEQLSWAESAMLAVLPNAPSLIHPGKNRKILLQKRNRLLWKLFAAGQMDKETYHLSELEPLPEKPYPIPKLAPQLLTRIIRENKSGLNIATTIDFELQNQVLQIIGRHAENLKFNQIYNAAALVLDVETGNALAYVGNTSAIPGQDHGNSVDIITAQRSPGSILKPFLFAAMIDDGMILPNTLIPDIPVILSGYSPKNYSNTFDGAVPAQRALSRSLNIPAVFMLREYAYPRFYDFLKKAGMKSLLQPSAHYGLSLVLGGAETSLWEVAGMYASMSRVLNHFYSYSGKYNPKDFHPPCYESGQNADSLFLLKNRALLNASSVWLTYKALVEVNRPDVEEGWQWYSSSRQLAWKTGTSFGFRDAWAIGTDPKHVVAVWVGNADGEGRPGLTGINCAAPVLFEIFNRLPKVPWFDAPLDELHKAPVCRLSGQIATGLCRDVDTVLVPAQGLRTLPCPFHQKVHLDKTGKFRVNSDCYPLNQMKHLSWFVLPPVQEYYYARKNPLYKTLPPLLPDCQGFESQNPMQFIYPAPGASVYVPLELDKEKGQVIFELAHRKPESTVYWSLDGFFAGTTTGIHQRALSPSPGKHLVTVVDNDGNALNLKFKILGKQE